MLNEYQLYPFVSSKVRSDLFHKKELKDSIENKANYMVLKNADFNFDFNKLIIDSKFNDIIEELKKRIEKRDFEFDIYGGISDCFLKDIENENKAEFMERREARGMIPVDIVAGFSQIAEECKIIRVLYLNTFFYQGFKVEFKVKETTKTVNGIAVWSVDDVERFRKGDVE